MKNQIKQLLYSLYFLFIFAQGHAQEYIVNVQQFGVEDGLAGRDVESLFVDKDGFLWVSGHDYMQRYDGYEFKSYELTGTRGKVKNVFRISQDKEGWFRLLVGYNINSPQMDILFFDPITGETISKEEKLRQSFAAQLDLALNNYNYDVATIEEQNDLMYFSGNNHILLLDYQKNSLDTIPLSFYNKGKFKIEFIDSKSIFWCRRSGGTETALLKVSAEGVLLDSLQLENRAYHYHLRIREWENQLYVKENHQDNMRVGVGNTERKKEGQDCFYKLKEDGSLQKIFKPPLGYRILKFFDGRIWCINELGWKVYNLSGELDFELKKENYGNELFDLFNYAEFNKDNTGKVFFGAAFGLNIIEIQENPFTKYFSNYKKEKLPIENSARGIYDSNDEVIANLEFGGLVSSSKENPDTFTMHAPHSYEGKKTGMYAGRPIVRDLQGNYFVAEIGYVRKWSPDFADEKKFYLQKYEDIWSLFIDEEECLWIGGNIAVGLICKGDSLIKEYSHKVNGIGLDRLSIYQIQEGKPGKLWFSTENGLYEFDKTAKKIVAHYHSKADAGFFIPVDFIYYLHIDRDNNKWLGTKMGLVFWNTKTNEKRLFNRNDGLSNNVIYAIKEDDYNRLWLSSDYGIMSFDKKSFAVRTYLPKDGTSDNEYNRVGHHQSKDGRIYFGSLNGVTAFHPKDFISEEETYPAVVIADYEIFDGSETKLLNKTRELSDTKTITFHPSDRYFKLKFVLPTFDEQNKILYGWKMKGVYEDWNYQKENTLQFSALPYGKHELRIKGQGVSGGWSPKELVIQVDVLKPFYLQGWFLISAVLFILFAFWRYNTYRINKLRKDKERLEQDIKEATAEIQAANTKIQEDKTFIEQQAAELKQLDQLKSRFFANVSHELRTPLSLMIGPIKNLLKNGAHSEKDRKLLEFVKRNSLHLKNLVNEILDLSKLESNKMELQESPVAFYEYVRSHMSQFYSFGNSELISFTTNFPEDRNVNILLDKNKFEKVINNFLSNAMKFTPPGGKVNLTIEESEADLHLMVQDTGRGIHPDDLPHVFDRFYQSTQTDAPTEGGTGIGLSLCLELAKLMDGKVWAESVLGEGSTFHFQFPKKLADPNAYISKNIDHRLEIEESEEHSDMESSVLSTPITQQYKHEATILIAEDNADLRAYYEILLSDYQVVLTEHGQAALDYLKQANEVPHLILSDLMMPVMDGMQFLTRVKSDEKWRHIPVIMLTAKANRITKLSALRIGIDDYITKPFDDEELLVRVQNMLIHQRDRSLVLKEHSNSDEKALVSTSKHFSDEEMEWLEALENFVKAHIDDDRLSVNLLVEEFNMSNSTLLRQLRKLTGLTGSKYISEHRLNHARYLLENRRYATIAQVAYKVGFKNSNAFTRSFKQRFGITPTEVFEG